MVTVRGGGGYEQQISIGKHHLRADEPIAAGGTDQGPTPYQLLLAALGSCISMTVSLYARRKAWPLERVEVRLSHDKIHADDCADCETREGRIDRIRKELIFEGPLDDEQRARLLEIAGRCPVHRTLRSEIQIVDTSVAAVRSSDRSTAS
jgi:putative redox protein